MNWDEKCVIFDLDGTLVDTAPDLHASLAYAFARRELPSVDLATVRSAIGHGAIAMIRKSAAETGTTLSDDLLKELHHDFLDYYVRHIADHSRPFPGITDTLNFCADKGAKIAICTNKTQSLAEELLTELGLTDRFDAIMGADRTSDKKPSPTHIRETISLVGGRILQAVMIGDSSTDARAAKAAGIPFVFMTYGYPDAEIDTLQPDLSLSSARDLPAAILNIFS